MALTTTDFPPFRERFPWRGPHLQTIRNTLRNPQYPIGPIERLSFPLADGTGDTLLGALDRPASPRDGTSLVVLTHGLTGCEDSHYVRATAHALLGQGYRVLRLNLRGAGPSNGLCRQRYHGGRTGDIREVLAQLAPELTANGVVLVGYSLGGNATLKLLGEAPAPDIVRAAASISAPIDLAGCSHRFQQPANRVYHNRLLRQMKRETLTLGPHLDPDLAQAVVESRTVWEFDDRVIGPWHGWKDAAEYYRVNSAAQFLPSITVPTLIIHALDDPWIPPDPYLGFDWASNRHLTPLLTPRGGHVGFHGVGGVWYDACLIRFLAAQGL